MYNSYFGSRKHLNMEGYNAMPQHGMMMQPVVMPMMFYCAPAPGVGSLSQDPPPYSKSPAVEAEVAPGAVRALQLVRGDELEPQLAGRVDGQSDGVAA